MRKVILVVFSPRLKVWRAHEKACPRKISTAEVHINSSKYQTVCELLTPCRFLHAFISKRKRDRGLNTISAGTELISWEGAMPLGKCNAGVVLLIAWQSWNNTNLPCLLPVPPCRAEPGCLGVFLICRSWWRLQRARLKASPEEPAEGGGGFGRTKGPGNLASFLIYLVPGLGKCLYSRIIQVQWLYFLLTVTALSCCVYWLELFIIF